MFWTLAGCPFESHEVQRFLVPKYADRVVPVPGNHDHHMWLLANEGEDVVRKFPAIPPGFVRRGGRWYASSFLNAITSHPDAFEVAYPNVYWQPSGKSDGAYIMHYGHFCEETYTILSDLYVSLFNGKVPDLDALESINCGWVEMIWYHLGQGSLGFGADGFVETVYERMRDSLPHMATSGCAADEVGDGCHREGTAGRSASRSSRGPAHRAAQPVQRRCLPRSQQRLTNTLPAPAGSVAARLLNLPWLSGCTASGELPENVAGIFVNVYVYSPNGKTEVGEPHDRHVRSSAD